MNEQITLGQIVKPQGIKGEVKIKTFTDDISRFGKLRAVFLDNVLYKISNLRMDNASDFIYIKFLGIDDRNMAENLRGKFVKIDRVHAIVPDEGAYFIDDLIGSDFFIDNKLKGKITNIYQNGSADVFEVDLNDGGTILFPHLKLLNLIVDVQKGQVFCQKSQLDKVAVFED